MHLVHALSTAERPLADRQSDIGAPLKDICKHCTRAFKGMLNNYKTLLHVWPMIRIVYSPTPC